MDKQFDVVIVGSGLGGLLCGAILSKKGKSVCILEKHFQIGGNLQTFKRKGVEFDTGMHYFGCMEKGQILHKLFSYLNIIDKIEVQQLEANGFEKICIGEDEYLFPQGFENFEAQMVKYFPEEKEAIQAYIKKIKSFWDDNKLLNLEEIFPEDLAKTDQYLEKIQDFLDSITENNRLKAVLCGNNGLYAGDPNRTPLYIHSVINNFFIRSAWRLVGGGSRFAEALKEVIEEKGGQVLTRKEVIGFDYDKNTITAALTQDGSRYPAENFISGIHPSPLIDLIAEKKFRKAYTQRVKALENTSSCFCLYLVLKPNAIKHFNSNLYYSSTENIWATQTYDPNVWPKGYMLYSTQDKTGEPYAESLTAMTFMHYEEVQEWENTPIGKRGEAYEAFKAKKAEAFIDLIEKKIPNIRDHIDTIYSSTPLTYKDYTGTEKGSMYGIMKDANDPLKTFVPTYTRIPNLFLTGQNLLTHGMLGTSMSALVTCAYFTDLNGLIKEIREIY